MKRKAIMAACTLVMCSALLGGCGSNDQPVPTEPAITATENEAVTEPATTVAVETEPATKSETKPEIEAVVGPATTVAVETKPATEPKTEPETEPETEEASKADTTGKKDEGKDSAKAEAPESPKKAATQGGHDNTEYATPAYDGTSYYTNTQTPMHLVSETLDSGLNRCYYVVDSFNTYALNGYLVADYGNDGAAWVDVHGDDFDAWIEIEECRATFVDGVYTTVPGNGVFLQMDAVLNIDGHGGPAPGLTNPITRHPENGGCYYFHYNTDYSYVSTAFRQWDRIKLALITPDYLGVESFLYDFMFNGTDRFGPTGDDAEYVGNTKIEYLGEVPTSNFEYIFRISQR